MTYAVATFSAISLPVISQFSCLVRKPIEVIVMKIFNADIHSLLLVIFFGGLQGLRVSCALDLGVKVLIDMEK